MPVSSTEAVAVPLPGLPCREFQELGERIAAAPDTEAVAACAASLLRFTQALVDDLPGHTLSALVSAMNDRLVCRIIALTAREHRLPPVAWCWLAFGSEGRHEQTFLTDQDNGLLFSAADDAEAAALRERFVPFAGAVNARLDRCGFAACKGEIMAGNPRWCLSLDEWRNTFIDWVRRPEPLALMHATIFFDLRPLWGDFALGETLRDTVLALTRDTPAFLHLMAANALQAQPPLSLLGEVMTAAEEGRQVVDLKKFGARIFVDAARIFALAGGGRGVATRDRLLEAGAAAGLSDDEIAAARDALSQILRLRLRVQAAALARGEVPRHGIDPAKLHSLDRALLRECLREAKRLQQRLKLNYAL